MFDSLADQMKHDDQEVTTPRERMIRYSVIAVLAVLIFYGLYMGVRLAS